MHPLAVVLSTVPYLKIALSGAVSSDSFFFKQLYVLNIKSDYNASNRNINNYYTNKKLFYLIDSFIKSNVITLSLAIILINIVKNLSNKNICNQM